MIYVFICCYGQVDLLLVRWQTPEFRAEMFHINKFSLQNANPSRKTRYNFQSIKIFSAGFNQGSVRERGRMSRKLFLS